jgi:hypothetical protein
VASPFLDFIRERFPEAERLAFDRIFARGHSIFFEKRSGSRRLLPQFTEELVFAALILAKAYCAELGLELVLTEAEERIFKGFLVPIVKRQ